MTRLVSLDPRAHRNPRRHKHAPGTERRPSLVRSVSGIAVSSLTACGGSLQEKQHAEPGGSARIRQASKLKWIRLADVFVEGLLNVFFGAVADELFYDLSILEDQQGGDTRHLVAHGCSAVAVNVHFADLDLARVFGGEFIDDGGNCAARAAPGRPEIHQHWFLRLQHVGIKIRVGYFHDRVTSHCSSQCSQFLALSSRWLAETTIASGPQLGRQFMVTLRIRCATTM